MIFVYRKRYATISDDDIARVRRVLAEEAARAGYARLSSFIDGWHEEVVELDAFFGGISDRERELTSVLRAARERGEPLESIELLRNLFPEIRGEEPSPDAVLVIWARNRKSRAEIMRRLDGNLEIFVCHEVPGDPEWEEGVTWTRSGGVLTDNLERAKVLAEEELTRTK